MPKSGRISALAMGAVFLGAVDAGVFEPRIRICSSPVASFKLVSEGDHRVLRAWPRGEPEDLSDAAQWDAPGADLWWRPYSGYQPFEICSGVTASLRFSGPDPSPADRQAIADRAIEWARGRDLPEYERLSAQLRTSNVARVRWIDAGLATYWSVFSLVSLGFFYMLGWGIDWLRAFLPRVQITIRPATTESARLEP